MPLWCGLTAAVPKERWRSSTGNPPVPQGEITTSNVEAMADGTFFSPGIQKISSFFKAKLKHVEQDLKEERYFPCVPIQSPAALSVSFSREPHTAVAEQRHPLPFLSTKTKVHKLFSYVCRLIFFSPLLFLDLHKTAAAAQPRG